MFERFVINAYYKINGESKLASKDNEDLKFKFQKSDEGRLVISIIPKQKIELLHVRIVSAYKFLENTCVMPNGYQSWTRTREYNRNDKMIGLRWTSKVLPIVKHMTEIFGDYMFKNYLNIPGFFHGYTYGYVRNGQDFQFIGSLSERSGYTIINFDMNNDQIIIEKDVDGLKIDKEYKLYDIIFLKGSYDDVFDKYFDAMNITKCRGEHTCGYTSWYNYFTGINEEIILRDLDGISKISDYVNMFQIDDGHQLKIGEWETTNLKKFPHGMKYIADKIHEKGMKAGIWLAPFYCQKSSKIAKEHPDWFIRDKNGKSPRGFVGFRSCYTFDIYNKECAAYIKKFFNTVLNDWGYDMVKLDFLYAQCLIPRYNKTRGEIMCDAMDFLRECVGDKLILGCGVPLGPSFGKVDFCRIGSDVDLHFKPRAIYQLTNNEVISTQTSIQNAIFRRGLNGRAFGNDPDVFFMRDINLNFTLDEKLLLAEINKTFGNLLFVSDNVGDFDKDQIKYLKDAYTKTKKKIEFVDYKGNNEVNITYTEDDKKYLWHINWLIGENTKTLI